MLTSKPAKGSLPFSLSTLIPVTCLHATHHLNILLGCQPFVSVGTEVEPCGPAGHDGRAAHKPWRPSGHLSRGQPSGTMRPGFAAIGVMSCSRHHMQRLLSCQQIKHRQESLMPQRPYLLLTAMPRSCSFGTALGSGVFEYWSTMLTGNCLGPQNMCELVQRHWPLCADWAGSPPPLLLDAAGGGQ